MARKHEAVSWLAQGLSPAQIANRMGVSVDTVMAYLYNQVGERQIRLSDILFTIPEATRKAATEIESAGRDLHWSGFREIIRKKYPEINPSEAWIYLGLKTPDVYLGDMYVWLYALEAFLHTHIRRILTEHYGNEWWRKGIPDSIRAECAATRERDAEPAPEPYCYTTLLNLKEILEKCWDLFSRVLPAGPASDRKRLLSGLMRVNLIRNRVMHASKGVVPNEEDFRFLREFLDFVDTEHWNRTRGGHTEAA